MLKKLLKEPLIHFILLAFACFGLYALVNRSPAGGDDQIVITAAKVDQLSSLFANTWRRPPTAIELKGLIENYTKEEIYNREALALGLDKNDTSIRRRLRQKYEFLIDAEAEGQAPTDAQLQAIWRRMPTGMKSAPNWLFNKFTSVPCATATGSSRTQRRCSKHCARELHKRRPCPATRPCCRQRFR
jgi:hypothetical protein